MIEKFILLQRRYAVWILLFGLVVTLLCAKPAVKLMTTVATDLVHLLPNDYPSVQQGDKIKSLFNRRSSLYVIVHSSNPKTNEQIVKDLKPFLEKHELVSSALIEKQGFDFLNKHKLLLMDLGDIYSIEERLKDKIHKTKLGGLYVDLESEDTGQEFKFDDLVTRYKNQVLHGVQSRYRRNEDGTVYVVDVYPKSFDSTLGFFKKFGVAIDDHLKGFDFKKYGKDVEFGYAGAIKTRVDQYDALMKDLKVGGAVSLSAIFMSLFLFFWNGFRRQAKGVAAHLKAIGYGIIPVFLIFVPMIFSTLMAFAFCSLFFDKLNVVTSFLFAIIFGLGVDIGIHLVTRYLQDRRAGLSIDEVHKNIVLKTGKSCSISILTTVTSFYILIINDFKGFSDFGWIAGNGLVIALICYLIFQPCLVLLVDRLRLFGNLNPEKNLDSAKPLRQNIPHAGKLLAGCAVMLVLSLLFVQGVQFEWNFNNLKMKIPERERQRAFLKTTVGRVNSPASFMVESQVVAREITRQINLRKKDSKNYTTIDYARSYWSVLPNDQPEKLSVLKKIRTMLDDDALNSVSKEDQELIDEFKLAIDQTEPIDSQKIPTDISEVFWGNTGQTQNSIVYIAPKPDLEMDDGRNASTFLHDVGQLDVLGKRDFAVSDTMIFAEVLVTLFRDAKIAVVLSSMILLVLIFLHYRDVKKTSMVIAGLVTGIFWMFSVMEIFGLKLNFYNMIVIPAMIGMGEDNSVHVVDRYEELGRTSTFEVLRQSGKAAFMASLTTILGYAGLCFTNHPGLSSIGWMAIVGMGTCLLGSLVVLPLMLQVFLKPQENR